MVLSSTCSRVAANSSVWLRRRLLFRSTNNNIVLLSLNTSNDVLSLAALMHLSSHSFPGTGVLWVDAYEKITTKSSNLSSAVNSDSMK